MIPLEKRALGQDEVHLWYVFPEEASAATLREAYWELMSAEERARHDRFAFERLKHEHRVTRALVRTTLSRYAEVSPDRWTFVTNAYGRPEISGPSPLTPLRFNLSHTNGLIACLVARDRIIGVDVEDTSRSGNMLETVGDYFSPFEVRSLHGLAKGHQRPRFFEYWTLKEAYIKARGMGLSLPLEQFSFHLEECPGSRIRISFDPRLQDQPDAWQFCLHKLTARHQLAIAIRKGSDPDLRINLRHAIPLLEEPDREWERI